MRIDRLYITPHAKERFATRKTSNFSLNDITECVKAGKKKEVSEVCVPLTLESGRIVLEHDGYLFILRNDGDFCYTLITVIHNKIEKSPWYSFVKDQFEPKKEEPKINLSNQIKIASGNFEIFKEIKDYKSHLCLQHKSSSEIYDILIRKSPELDRKIKKLELEIKLLNEEINDLETEKFNSPEDFRKEFLLVRTLEKFDSRNSLLKRNKKTAEWIFKELESMKGNYVTVT